MAIGMGFTTILKWASFDIIYLYFVYLASTTILSGSVHMQWTWFSFYHVVKFESQPIIKHLFARPFSGPRLLTLPSLKHKKYSLMEQNMLVSMNLVHKICGKEWHTEGNGTVLHIMILSFIEWYKSILFYWLILQWLY